MAYEPEMIRRQMHETRSSLADKLETLEGRLAAAVDDVTSAATETAGAVKASVRDSVQTLHDAVDVGQQIQRQPWAAVATSVCMGFACGRLLTPSAQRRSPLADLSEHEANGTETALACRPALQPAASSAGRWFQYALQSFGPEIDKLKELAVGMAVGVVRDFVKNSAAASVKKPLTDVLNDITMKLGGRPLPEPVVGEEMGTANAGPHSYRRF